MISPTLVSTLERIVRLLAHERYVQAVAECSVSRLSPEDIEAVVVAYGRTINELPPESWSSWDLVEIAGSSGHLVSIAIPLWTVEEGRSDLTLEVTAKEANTRWDIELEDLHVL